MNWFSSQTMLFDAAIFAANWLLQSTLLLGTGLAIGKLLGKQGSAVQSAIYRTTLVAVLLCPIATWGLSQAGILGWSMKLPQGQSNQPSSMAAADFAEPVLVASPSLELIDAPVSTKVFETPSTDAPSLGVESPVEKQLDTPPVQRATHPFAIVALVASGLWLVVSCGLAVRLGLAWWRLARLRRGAIRADADTMALCHELASTFAVPAPAVLRSPYLPSPCLAGIRRPAVLLPEVDQNLSLRDVLIHELAHLRRHDCHWNLLRRMATALFWFQPLLWKLSHRIEATAEEVCDDFVVQHGASRQDYAHHLVDTAELSLAPIAAAGVGIVSLRSMLAQRVARIMDTSRTFSTRISNLLLVGVLASGLFGTMLAGLIGLASPSSQAESQVETESIAEKGEATPGDEKVQAKIAKEDEIRTVSGKVVGLDGKPVAGVRVTTPMRDKVSFEAKTNTQGLFELKIPKKRLPGMPLIATGPKGMLGFVQLPYQPKAELDPQRIELAAPRRINVTVHNAEGTPVSDVEVVAANMEVLARATSSTTGQAILLVPDKAPLQFILAQGDAGVDYALFRRVDEPKSDPYRLAPDFQGTVTLTLSPTRTVTVKVVDEIGQPVVDAQATPWLIRLPNHGRQNDSLNLGLLWTQKTNAQGIVEFDSIPIENERVVTIWVRKEGYVAAARTGYDPNSPETELTAVLQPLVPVRGRVVRADGAPAAGIPIRAKGAGYGDDSYRGLPVKTTADGTFALQVNPNQYYLFTAGDDSSAAQIVSRVILTESPEEVQLQLQPATRIYGQVTSGSNHRPIAKRYVQLYRYDGDQDYYKLPEEKKRLPNPMDSNIAIVPRIVQGLQTDSEGRFDFFTGPGKHYLLLNGHQNSDVTKFEVARQNELEFNIHVEHLAEGIIRGRVVLKSDPEQGVSEVRVFGYPDDMYGNHMRATTDTAGRFEDRRSGVAQLVGAFSEDRKLGVIERVEADADHFVLALAPTAMLRGVLIDEETGKPAANREIGASIQVGPKDGPHMSAFRRSDTTDTTGRFEIAGVVPGHVYALWVVTDRDNEGHARGWQTVGSAEPKEAGLLDLGELRLPAPHRPPTLEDQIARSFASDNAAQRLARALTDAKLSYQQVLLIVGKQDSDAVKQFFEAKYDYAKENIELRRALANYIALATTPEQTALFEKIDIASVNEKEAIYILRPSGQVVAKAPFAVLMPNGKLSREGLKEFLIRQAQRETLPDASQKYQSALQQAEKQSKRVFVQVSGPGCAPCVLLSRFLEAQKFLLAKEYVYLKLDARMPGGKDVIEKLRKNAGGGIPWMVILDAQGNSLITSDSDDGNIGFPKSSDEKSHFERMIRTTARNLSDEEIVEFLDGL